MLRAKSREANRTAKISAARIAELENQVMQLEQKVISETVPAKRNQKPLKAVGTKKRQGGSVDPGDVVPPDVVQEPAALNEDIETAGGSGGE
jgi:hypothetical protein